MGVQREKQRQTVETGSPPVGLEGREEAAGLGAEWRGWEAEGSGLAEEHAPNSLVPVPHMVSDERMCSAAQSCPTLCNPEDYSLPGSSVHGIFQARILEWIAISFSRGSS